MRAPILAVRDLSVRFTVGDRPTAAVRGVSLDLLHGQSVGLVGESGCGKSTLLKAIMRVLPAGAATVSGTVEFNGLDVLRADSSTLRAVRWAGIAMITQSALNALNPVLRVGDQIAEAMEVHGAGDAAAARQRISDLFDMVGVDRRRMRDFPHQLSGGMRQRVVIAMALALNPQVVLADEPTTALDVLVQAQIFERLGDLQARIGFAMLLVTHDLALVVERCERIAVMYAGTLVESGPTRAVVGSPLHPYTLGLKNALPTGRRSEPIAIPGAPPDLAGPLPVCVFAPRCPFSVDACRTTPPPIIEQDGQRWSRCHRARDMPALAAQAARPETWLRGERNDV